MKCLSKEKLKLAQGNVLHDWHAEILAIRGFNRWLVDECADLARQGLGGASDWVKWRQRGSGRPEVDVSTSDRGLNNDTAEESKRQDKQPFAICDDVSIHMYVSQCPCGDASMELTMASQADATPWESQPPADEMLGRGNFDRLGVVRRKPSRADAPVTDSKSCSDKLALKQCTSLLSGLTSPLVHPSNAYLSTLVLPEPEIVPKAVERAFGASGRMASVASVSESWKGGYSYQPFEVKATSMEFEYAKPSAEGDTAVASNLSTLSTLSGRQEVLINGVLQGRKQFDPKGASRVSRRRLWEAVRDVAGLTTVKEAMGAAKAVVASESESYHSIKADNMLLAREKVKVDVRNAALMGWKRNTGDDDWTLS